MAQPIALVRPANPANYEMEMEGSECIASLRLQFSNNASPLRVQYDVCSEAGFGLTMTRIRF